MSRIKIGSPFRTSRVQVWLIYASVPWTTPNLSTLAFLARRLIYTIPKDTLGQEIRFHFVKAKLTPSRSITLVVCRLSEYQESTTGRSITQDYLVTLKQYSFLQMVTKPVLTLPRILVANFPILLPYIFQKAKTSTRSSSNEESHTSVKRLRAPNADA